MSIKRYIANKDTTITDSFLQNNIQRAINSNMGAADSLEIFSLYGQVGKSVEKSRILIEFPIEDIKNDRINSVVPSSGSVKFFMKLFNVEHPYSVPRDFSIVISPLSQSWDEGYGLDMESYQDLGWNNINEGSGATWRYNKSGSLWSVTGAVDLNKEEYNYQYSFKSGIEDVEVDITNIVEKWISEEEENNGFLVKLSGSFEDGSLNTSFYTKKFSARGSQFFFKRPCIEARWEAISTDDRNNFYRKSNALSIEDNKMNLFYYNKVNGRLKNIVGNILPDIKLYSDIEHTNEIIPELKTVTNPLSGVYKAQIVLDTDSSIIYDSWYNTSSFVEYFSDSFDVLEREKCESNQDQEYVISITNNKLLYSDTETARFNIFVREKDWSPTIYKVSYNNIENTSIPDLYYKIFRLNDNYVVMDYSTGSLAYTKTSYDVHGNYFDLNMSILEKNYNYGVKLARWDGSSLKENPTIFKFKVE